MAFEVAFLTKTNAASLTRERFLFRMDTLMPGQIVLYAETPAAYVARMIFFTRMHRQVYQHLLSPTESFGTICAIMRELVRMGLIVYVNGRFGLERFAAGMAYVRAFTSVNTSMILHGGLHGKAAAAYVASVIFHAIVHVLQVIIQATALNELLPANVARVRLLSRMNAYVDAMTFPGAKLFVANLTD